MVSVLGVLVGAARESSGSEPAYSTFRIVPERSEVRFVLKATKHDVIGRTGQVEGEVVATPDTLSDAREGFAVIEAATLDAGNPIINRNMRGKLETGKYPLIRFRAKQFVEGEPAEPDAAGWRGRVKGELTVRGVTRPVELDVVCRREEGKLRAKGSAQFKLTDFGIDPPRFLRFFRVKDRVLIEFDVVATQESGLLP
jgi:polyisoprenoid-binding protein YceI